MENTIKLGCNRINSAEIGINIDNVRIIENNKSEMVKSKVDIIAKEK